MTVNRGGRGPPATSPGLGCTALSWSVPPDLGLIVPGPSGGAGGVPVPPPRDHSGLGERPPSPAPYPGRVLSPPAPCPLSPSPFFVLVPLRGVRLTPSVSPKSPPPPSSLLHIPCPRCVPSPPLCLLFVPPPQTLLPPLVCPPPVPLLPLFVPPPGSFPLQAIIGAAGHPDGGGRRWR